MMIENKSFFQKTKWIWIAGLVVGIVIFIYSRLSHPHKLSEQKESSPNDPSKSELVDKSTFIHINKIAKKSKAEVDAYLGPSGAHQSVNFSNTPCPCEKYQYKDGNIEIVFMKDKADWISVFHMNAVPYNDTSILKALKLPLAKPVVHTETVMKWNDTNGFDQLSAFSDGNGGVSYIFLKAITH